jgi:hypothetical protein
MQSEISILEKQYQEGLAKIEKEMEIEQSLLLEKRRLQQELVDHQKEAEHIMSLMSASKVFSQQTSFEFHMSDT